MDLLQQPASPCPPPPPHWQAKRAKAQPKLNPDGSVRLNARQRRTLRRAQERAMKALMEAHEANGSGAEAVRRAAPAGTLRQKRWRSALQAPAGKVKEGNKGKEEEE